MVPATLGDGVRLLSGCCQAARCCQVLSGAVKHYMIQLYHGKPVRGHGGGRFASSSPGPAPVRGLSTVLPEWRSDRSRPFVSDMCTKFHGATSAPHGGKGETGQGAKEKTPRKPPWGAASFFADRERSAFRAVDRGQPGWGAHETRT